jgi:hypothetical protein
MNTTILDAATLYVTNKATFEKEFGNSLHKDYLDMLFLNAATRPDLAETITMTLLGITPYYTKHGYDGHMTKRQVEVKVGTTTVDARAPSSFAAISVNDISQTIIDRYDLDNPLFLFSYYVNGNLCAIFEVKWSDIRVKYVDALRNCKNRVTTKICPITWEDNAKIRFANSDPAVLALLPPTLFNLLP